MLKNNHYPSIAIFHSHCEHMLQEKSGSQRRYENTANFQDLHSHADTDTTAAPHQRYEDSNQHQECAARMKRNTYKSLFLKYINICTLTQNKNTKLGPSLNSK